MKALILTDKANWSYHSIAKALVKYNADPNMQLDVAHIKGGEKRIKKIHKRYDKFLVMGHQTYERVNFLPKKHTLVGLHGHHAWDKRKTTPDKDVEPPKKLIDFLNTFRAVNAVSYRLYKLFQEHGIADIVYTANGVDTEIFKPKTDFKDPPIIGYSGSKSHDWRKGITEFILPAAKRAKVKAIMAMLGTGSYVAVEEMPEFYKRLDIYTCASSSEGYSLSVLEAAACGLAVISTRVGGCVDLIEHGHNGFLVGRDAKDIAKHIKILKEDRDLLLKISQNMVESVKNKWCWSIRTKDWIDFIRDA